jgi:hypothetical protein
MKHAIATKKASKKTEREGGRKSGVNEGKTKDERARGMTHRSRRSRGTSEKDEEMEEHKKIGEAQKKVWTYPIPE